MKQRTVYWLPSIRGMVFLSALMMTCSGLIRAAWAAGEPALPASVFLFQVLLPLWANLCFVWFSSWTGGSGCTAPPFPCGWAVCFSR